MLRPIALALVVLSLSPAAFSAPPTDVEIKQKVQEFYKGYDDAKLPDAPSPEQIAAMKKAMEERAARLLEGIQINELSDDARRQLQPLLSASPKHRAIVDALLASKASVSDIAGFEAACELIEYANGAESAKEARAARILAAIDHPAAVDAAKVGKASELVWSMSELPADAMKARADRLAAMARAMVDSGSPDAMREAPMFLSALAKALPHDTFEPVREAAVAAATKRLAATTDEREKKSLTRALGLLNGAAMRGELLDHPVPSLTFLKVYGADASGAQTGTAPWKTLADLKGKVVVLDFWATWCGPCVGSFPTVKDLRKQFSEKELEIVGVTSLQGFVVSKDHQKIDCKGDAAKEEAELANFLNAMGVTWTVGLSEQDVFNPDFGIQGIPYVAIVDQNGIVRKTNLHPMNHDVIVSTINELLHKPGDTKTTAAESTTH
ncbi:MAG: TlpA disulfide reductase family protein [Phycisphaerales bacterium]